MPDALSPPPEAELIRVTRSARGMTVAGAARQMAATCPEDAVITAAYWRDVERGEGTRRGKRVPVRASARTLAFMAAVVGADSGGLEKADRQDAADILRQIIGAALADEPEPDPDPIASLEAWLEWFDAQPGDVQEQAVSSIWRRHGGRTRGEDNREAG